MLEINLSIKCGNCTSVSTIEMKRLIDDELFMADSLNNAHHPKFTANQTYPDAIYITCESCGYEEVLNI